MFKKQKMIDQLKAENEELLKDVCGLSATLEIAEELAETAFNQCDENYDYSLWTTLYLLVNLLKDKQNKIKES